MRHCVVCVFVCASFVWWVIGWFIGWVGAGTSAHAVVVLDNELGRTNQAFGSVCGELVSA
jgi:hypothetical protein